MPVPPTTRFSYISRKLTIHRPIIPASPQEQFRQTAYNLVRSAFMADKVEQYKPKEVDGLKKMPPYWYPYTTMTKMRWIGREILEVVSTEFRDRSMEYYRYALESGVTTVNGKIAKPDTVLVDGDRVENVVHRHEPPVTSKPVKILLHDKEREFIVVDKPGSIPVHASGRYNRNSLIEILVEDFGFTKCYPINRLDRLTSGLMIIPLSAACARTITKEFAAGTVRKEYVARVKGCFPSEEIVCEQPLLTVDRQMGLNIVHPKGKHAKTVFNLIRYDTNTDSSIVRCEGQPFTGRSHQLRVHLQFLGHPIANDPIYSEKRIWGENMGMGGIDVTPSDFRQAPAPPTHLLELVESTGSPESLSKGDSPFTNDESEAPSKLLPRETGEDIGMGSPVPLSQQAVEVITKLRNMKDEDEDWSRWRDVVFRAKGVMRPKDMVITPPPPQNRRKRGGKAETVRPAWNNPNKGEKEKDASAGEAEAAPDEAALIVREPAVEAALPSLEKPVPSGSEGQGAAVDDVGAEGIEPQDPAHTQITLEEAIEQVTSAPPTTGMVCATESEQLYCSECYLPLHPDPKPEKLYIFLHALKYTTSLGAFSTEMPDWAAEGWEWDQD